METTYEQAGEKEKKLLSDLQWFFSKSKVSISLAITDSSPFLYSLNYTGVLSEEELLELLEGSASGRRMVYESLCCIEQNKFPLQIFFEQLFDKNNLKKYPDLKPIFLEYSMKQYRNRSHVTADVNTDPIIFAQDKVKICIAITDIFPFVHGLQDLQIISETESLKLQADRRPVSRVIYKCLSLIEKKDLKLNVVFEYIFQECYLKFYSGLQHILQEPNTEHIELFRKQPAGNLRTFLKENKDDISEAIHRRFPFLHGLHDIGMLSRIQLLRLQADKRPTKDVMLKTLGLIEESSDLEAFFTYAFWDFYLCNFPRLKDVLQRINEAIKMDASPPLADTLGAPEHHKGYKPDSRRDTPGLDKASTAVYPKQMVPGVSTDPMDASYKSQSDFPQSKKYKKRKVHNCDYEGCQKGFSDRSELKLHRKRHEVQQKSTYENDDTCWY